MVEKAFNRWLQTAINMFCYPFIRYEVSPNLITIVGAFMMGAAAVFLAVFLESDYPVFNCNLVLRSGESTPAFSNTTGFFVTYEYLIKKNIQQAELGAIRQSTTAKYDIKRKALLPMINHDAGDLLSVSNNKRVW
ncbi:MAG: hypothetical protein JNL74_12345 [Fibrobacteres bacterium]|nr:hypothetical protein [Fibrobacterota bacterium]